MIRVDHQAAARADQFGARGGDDRRLQPAAFDFKRDVIELAFALGLLNLGLGDGGAVGRVPQGRLKAALQQALVEQVQERHLADGPALVGNGLVFAAPVHRQSQAREQIAELLLVRRDHLFAQRHEVFARHGPAAHLLHLLHQTLGRQTIVVPADGIKHVSAAHPHIARHDVGLGVGIDMTHMQRARHGRRRRVDHIITVRRRARIPDKGVVLGPAGAQGGFRGFGVVLVGKRFHVADRYVWRESGREAGLRRFFADAKDEHS